MSFIGIVIGFCLAVLIARVVKYFMDRSAAASLEADANPALAELMRERNSRSPVKKTGDVENDGKFEAVFTVTVAGDSIDAAVGEDLVREISKWFNLRGLESGRVQVDVLSRADISADFTRLWEDTVLAAPRIEQLARIGCELGYKVESAESPRPE